MERLTVINASIEHSFSSFDGAKLAWREIGEGRAVILLHGLFSDANTNWIKFGHAAAITAEGFRVIMPDLRAHGESGKPHDPQAYPDDVLAMDAEALVAHLALDDYDLGGFSLGARTAVRIVAGGARPRRLVLAGMGVEGLSGWERRRAFFTEAIDRADTVSRGDPHWLAVQFMKTMKVDGEAARLLLDAQRDSGPAELAAATMPTLVVCGDQDDDNGSATALAEALPDGRYVEVPGTHMSSVAKPELGRAIADFLAE